MSGLGGSANDSPFSEQMSGPGGSADACSPCDWCRNHRYFFQEQHSADSKPSSRPAPRTNTALPQEFTKGLLLRYFPKLFKNRAKLDGLVFADIQALLCEEVLKPMRPRLPPNSMLRRLYDLFQPSAGCLGDGEPPCKQTGRSKTFGLRGDPPIEKSTTGETDESDQFGVSHGGERIDSHAGCDAQETGESDESDQPDEFCPDEDSAEWRSHQAYQAKVLVFFEELKKSTKRIEAVLMEHAGMDPRQHFKLAEQLARVLLLAKTEDRQEWPPPQRPWLDSEVETLINRNGNFISKHLDIPDEMMCLIPDGGFWVRILEAAFDGWQGWLPVHYTSTLPMSYYSHEYRPGRIAEHAHLFTFVDGAKMMLVVGLTKWEWINSPKITCGSYDRMYALAVRTADSDDDIEDDYNSDLEDRSDIELDDDDSDPEFADIGGAVHRMYDGKHCYPPDAEHPEVVWRKNGTFHWFGISGPARPGYWRKPLEPVITMHPVKVENGMEWKVRSVRALREGIYSGRFALEIENQEICKQLADIIKTGSSKAYERMDPTAMRRFLHAVTNHIEEVLYQAKIRVQHHKWPCLHNWISFGELVEAQRLPVNVRFPGVDKDSGASLKCELKLAKNMLIAQVDFEYLGEHGPAPRYGPSSCSSLDVRIVDQLLGSDGSQQLMTAMRLSMGLSSKPVTIRPAAKTEWFQKRNDRPYWMNRLIQDWDDLKLFIPVVELLAAGALPDNKIGYPSYSSERTVKNFTEDGYRGLLQSADFNFQTASGNNWMTVTVERKLLEYREVRDSPAVKPNIIMLKLTVQKGQASPPCVGSNGHSARRLLGNYLDQNSLCKDNVADLLNHFKEGGNVSLKTYEPWYRLLYAGKCGALQQRFLDMIGMLCLCSGGGKIKSSSPLRLSTHFVCGDGCNTREMPWQAELDLSATVEDDQLPEKFIRIRLGNMNIADTLHLELRVENNVISSIGNQASLASAVQNVPQVKNVVLLLLVLYAKIG